jgi:protein-disulfide isomerase
MGKARIALQNVNNIPSSSPLNQSCLTTFAFVTALQIDLSFFITVYTGMHTLAAEPLPKNLSVIFGDFEPPTTRRTKFLTPGKEPAKALIPIRPKRERMKTVQNRFRIVSLVWLALQFAGVSLLSAQAAKPPFNSNPDDDAVASIDGAAVISSAQLEKEVQGRLISLKSQEYRIKREVLDERIEEFLLQQEAGRRGMTVDQLTREEIDLKVPSATEDQIKAVYDSTKDKYGDKSQVDAFKQIAENLHDARVNLRRKEFLDELRGKSEVKIYLDAPRVAVKADDTRAWGPKDAPVTIVEFGEFQCPFCGRSAGTLKQLEAKYGNQIRIVFRDFPLAFHQNAPKAAEAASCANEQGKFWEMHDKLFKNQSSLTVPDLKRYATEIKLSSEQFDQCLDSGKYTRHWQADRDEGSRYGITGTPTFFINGRMLVGSLPLEEFSQIIDQELERGALPKSAAVVAPQAVPAAETKLK